MHRVVRLTVAYEGTAFCGWQAQPQVPTIQAALSDAIQAVTAERPAVEGSGRTDAGVHALAQVAAFRTTSLIPAANLIKALNRHLPAAIRVLDAADAPAAFHPRFDARAKTYRYRIYRGSVCPPFISRYVHHFPYPLDEAAMGRAAPLFEGAHDFTSFASTHGHSPNGSAAKSRVRHLFSSQLSRQDEELVYTVRGSGFLHHMVRNIAGTLVEVGKGRREADSIPAMIEARRRSVAGPTLPARGLCLVSVEYDERDA